jgi:hypothetical protein
LDVNVVSLPSTVPWTAIISSLTAVLVLAGTLIFNYFSNRQRLDHEQQLNTQRLDQERQLSTQQLDHVQTMKLREERLKAYAAMARITKNAQVADPLKIADLAEAQSEIEMLTEDAEVLYAAHHARQQQSRKENFKNSIVQADFEKARDELDQHRTNFINLTRKELGLGPRPFLPTEEGQSPGVGK